MPRDPPAVEWTTGRVAGADTCGAGSGWLCTAVRGARCATEPVTSPEARGWDRDAKGFSAKRVASELQPAASTENAATMTGRDQNESEQRSSLTQRIGQPTRTHQTASDSKHGAGK